MTFPTTIDRARLQESSGGDVAFEQELLTVFIDDAQEHLASIHRALKADPPAIEVIYRAAHHLKGSSGSIGATAFKEIASQLEQTAQANDSCHDLFTRLEQAYTMLFNEIQQWTLEDSR